MDDESFKKVLEYFDLSWQGYRRVRRGVKNRITRHMHELGLRSVPEYLDFIRKTPEHSQKVKERLTVSISRFFRDLYLWEILERCIIPDLLDTPLPPVRAWVAGCACGEEAYSLKIVWDRRRKELEALPELAIWATDLNPVVLEIAKKGIFSMSSLREVRGPVRDEYFTPVPGGFSVVEDIRGTIHWLRQDIVSDAPPGSSFDIIFLRNSLLTYYLDPFRIRGFIRVSGALRPGGYLIIGNNEAPPEVDVGLRRFPECRSVFVKSARPE